ncbi:MAG: class II fructose-bisphosphate aldolase [Patescibacteria group bacterium]|jgi:fructose-bisphosphate aldolase class II
MLTHISELIADAKQHEYALGAFNVDNLETTLVVVRAAVQKKSPLIIQISERTIKYGGLKTMTAMIETMVRDEAGQIPIALHLDHGKSFRSVAECIAAGFSSIMIDNSDVPFKENVILTRQSVEYAHKKDAWVQGELGVVKGLEEASQDEREKVMTDPAEAKQFVEETDIDTLAVAIGNVHGIVKLKKGLPKLNIKRLKEIHAAMPDMPLVLHGASGVRGEDIRETFAYGMRIINLNTELKLAFSNSLRDTLIAHPEFFDIRDYFEKPMTDLQAVIEERLELFGSVGRA